jgi:hypothetical protein
VIGQYEQVAERPSSRPASVTFCRWFFPLAALNSAHATIYAADKYGYSLVAALAAFSALGFALMAGALWADKLTASEGRP